MQICVKVRTSLWLGGGSRLRDENRRDGGGEGGVAARKVSSTGFQIDPGIYCTLIEAFMYRLHTHD